MIFSLLRALFRLLFSGSGRRTSSTSNGKRVLITPEPRSLSSTGVLLALFLPIKPVFAVYVSIGRAGFMLAATLHRFCLARSHKP